jgi:hypothetical protein
MLRLAKCILEVEVVDNFRAFSRVLVLHPVEVILEDDVVMIDMGMLNLLSDGGHSETDFGGERSDYSTHFCNELLEIAFGLGRLVMGT